MLKSTLILICTNIILTFITYSQEIIDLTPELGTNYVYRQLAVIPSDTGSIGMNQVWDYSGRGEVDFNNKICVYRVPTGTELSNYPEVNYVSEWSSTQPNYSTNFYAINPDSVTLLGQITTTSTTNFLNPFVDYYLPMNSSTYFIDTCDNTNFAAEPSFIINETFFQGSGTLITPYGSHTNSLKFKSIRKKYANINDNFPYSISEVYFWLNPENRTFIFQIYKYQGNEPGLSYTNLTLANVSSASVNELFLNSAYISPNPTNSNIIIVGQSGNENVDYEVVDMNGKQLLNGKLNNDHKIYTEELMNGVYTIRLKWNSSVKILKFVKL